MLTVLNLLARALCVVILLASVLALSHDTRHPQPHNDEARQ